MAGEARFAGIYARGVIEHIDVARDGHRLAEGGFWVLVGAFDGRIDAWRMAEVSDSPPNEHAPSWHGPQRDSWRSSLSRDEYMAGVERIRADIRDGEVYQVNLCRVLSASLPGRDLPHAAALADVLARGNPARYGASIEIPDMADARGAWVVSASPELYLAVDGNQVLSSPIKGTAAPGEQMLPKDEAENVMITDLVRNDISHVAEPGSVAVPEFLGLHDLPGLRHLQSTVSATLTREHAWTPQMWPHLLDGTFPPGSVSGAPKSAALRIIEREERAVRGPYCGAVGWIDADARRAELAVGIRTFWWDRADGGTLRFGTGAGITWGSDPAQEWAETELKAKRLIALASTGTMSP